MASDGWRVASFQTDGCGLLQPGSGLRTLRARVKNARRRWEHHTCRYANQVPLAEGAEALKVIWCEVSVTDDNAAAVAASDRARWKIENENNNTLKTKGYHLENCRADRRSSRTLRKNHLTMGESEAD